MHMCGARPGITCVCPPAATGGLVGGGWRVHAPLPRIRGPNSFNYKIGMHALSIKRGQICFNSDMGLTVLIQNLHACILCKKLGFTVLTHRFA